MVIRTVVLSRSLLLTMIRRKWLVRSRRCFCNGSIRVVKELAIGDFLEQISLSTSRAYTTLTRLLLVDFTGPALYSYCHCSFRSGDIGEVQLTHHEYKNLTGMRPRARDGVREFYMIGYEDALQHRAENSRRKTCVCFWVEAAATTSMRAAVALSKLLLPRERTVCGRWERFGWYSFPGTSSWYNKTYFIWPARKVVSKVRASLVSHGEVRSCVNVVTVHVSTRENRASLMEDD